MARSIRKRPSLISGDMYTLQMRLISIWLRLIKCGFSESRGCIMSQKTYSTSHLKSRTNFILQLWSPGTINCPFSFIMMKAITSRFRRSLANHEEGLFQRRKRYIFSRSKSGRLLYPIMSTLSRKGTR